MEPVIRSARADEIELLVDIDDDASRRYATAGIAIELAEDHAFVRDERARWERALRDGRAWIAEREGRAVGIAVCALVDGAPYLDQLSVRVDAMDRGVGRALLRRAIAWAEERGGGLWLDTYDHLVWNRPYYERAGFVVVPEQQWGPELRAIVARQREVLPDPERRVAMHRA